MKFITTGIKKVIGGVFGVVGICVILGAFFDVNGFSLPLLIVGAITLIIGVFCLKPSKNDKEVYSKLKEYDESITCYHILGLPVQEGAETKIHVSSDNLLIKTSGIEFSLNYPSITNIEVKTQKEVQTQYVSSVGGAIAGGMLFGPIGAIVAGRIKAKKVVNQAYYVLITYFKEDGSELAGLTFEIGDKLFPADKMKRLVKNKKPLFKKDTKITL